MREKLVSLIFKRSYKCTKHRTRFGTVRPDGVVGYMRFNLNLQAYWISTLYENILRHGALNDMSSSTQYKNITSHTIIK